MKNLKTAIYTKFTELIVGVHNSFYNAVSGKLYFERAPANAVLPYAVYHLISDVTTWNFSHDFEEVRIQVDLFSSSDSSSEVEDLYTALKALFDWCSLNITGSTCIYMRRENARLSRDPQDDNWTYNVDYQIMTEKAR